MSQIKRILQQLKQAIDARVEASDPPYVLFGIFGLINYPSFYLIWYNTSPDIDATFTLRLIATLLSLSLLVHEYWPQKLKPWLPVIWYLTLWQCIAFMGTFMILTSHVTDIALMNGMLGLFLLVLLIVDWLAFICILSVGIFAGWLTYTLLHGPVIITTNNLFAGVSSYILAIIIGAVFSGNFMRMKENLKLKNQIKAMKLVGASIAHELRTPLATIRSGVTGTKKYLPQFIEAYQLAKQANLPISEIQPRHIELLMTVMDDIEAETYSANTIINMLLVKINDNHTLPPEELEAFAIADCIDEAIRRYPFKPSSLAEKIHWRTDNNFMLRGSRLFIIHILFNLIKNALYYLAASRKGEVQIWLERGSKYHYCHFKDTGSGISKEILPHIFDRFYSQTHNGTGIGLAFCKMAMESMGGKIQCKSVQGEYTHFILAFPVDAQLEALSPTWQSG